MEGNGTLLWCDSMPASPFAPRGLKPLLLLLSLSLLTTRLYKILQCVSSPSSSSSFASTGLIQGGPICISSFKKYKIKKHVFAKLINSINLL